MLRGFVREIRLRRKQEWLEERPSGAKQELREYTVRSVVSVEPQSRD